MKPTEFDIYRNDDGEFSFEKTDRSFELLHPDDNLNGKTELHTFKSDKSYDTFLKEIKERAESGEEITWQEDMETPEGSLAIIVEFHDEETPEREIQEINHN